MKEIGELNFPDDVRYAESHEYAKAEGDTVKVGLSDYAQDQLGDIVFVEMPQVGDSFRKGEEFGTIESVKAVSELYMPVSAKIISMNTALDDSPQLVNKSPYNEGWMVEVKPGDPGELASLMNNDAYQEMLKGLE